MDLDLFSAFEQPAPPLRVDERASKKSRTVAAEAAQTPSTAPVSAPANATAPAKTYPFTLDPFQAEAIAHIERGESVLVAAHTSAGKTAVAEYAVAKSLKDGQRVIYTSPIKALSNQKYRDMHEEFADVGLMTGDMTINPGAACLIMTTEILRSMLYRGSEVIREVAWVVFDEVHYMRDKERGVVWEESIILLPHNVRFVFLSATIPNAQEFVAWVSHLHRQPCHVVYTDYRPVPLQHFLFPSGADGLFLVVDEKARFREDNFQRAMAVLQTPPELESKGRKQRKPTSKGSASDLFKIVRLVMERQLDPCIVFSFSKKDCEAYALQMGKLDFTTDDEKRLVEQVFAGAVDGLSDDDRQLPQVLTILPLLRRGVGIHHGGLLPILKEVIEILFQEGLIKCLFATETFSIGINMPAKTVVFTNTRKFDGKDFRWLTSGEYIQMSGRAGRRGKDDSGIVIQMVDEKIEPEVCKGMVYGASDPLRSSYHVSYNMVLNMLRVEDADPEVVLRSSFHQFQQERQAPGLELEASELDREAAAVAVADEEGARGWLALQAEERALAASLLLVVQRREHIGPFLQPGRMLFVEWGGVSWGWGVLVQCRKAGREEGLLGLSDGDAAPDLVLDILLVVSLLEEGRPELVPGLVHRPDPAGEMAVLRCCVAAVSRVSSVKLKLPRELNKDAVRRGVRRSVAEVERQFSAGVPLLDPVADMGIAAEGFAEQRARCAALGAALAASPLGCSEAGRACVAAYRTRAALRERASALRERARATQAVAMREELRRMKRVLRRLAYIDEGGVLQLKGRFCCEVTTADEVVLTDMVFDGAFNALSCEQTVGLLSCFVHKEASKDGLKVCADLEPAFRKLRDTARLVARCCVEAHMDLDEEEYVGSFNAGLVEVALAWARGAKFVDVCRLTDVFEGSIIRTLKRLEELLRQLASAAGAIGNAELKDKFEQGAAKIRRGVVFAASLYL